MKVKKAVSGGGGDSQPRSLIRFQTSLNIAETIKIPLIGGMVLKWQGHTTESIQNISVLW